MKVSDVSAKAGQKITITYPDDAPNRILFDPPYDAYNSGREVILDTEQAVDLYNQLRSALFD